MIDGLISVIMPAYNEATHIAETLREVVHTFRKAGAEFEVILVDDGSPDHTYREALKFVCPDPGRVRVVTYDENLGKGNALMCGTWFARGDYIVFLDADLDLHPEQLPALFALMERSGADAVIGSKRHPESEVEYPFIRRLYSVVYYSIIRLMFGLPIKDSQTGLKVFRAEVLQRVLPRILVKRFAFDIEVLANAHRLGFRIVDGPVRIRFRREIGRIRLRDAMNILTDTLAIFYRMHILRYYDRFDGVRLDDLRLSDSVEGLRVAEALRKS
ncbi:MAG: glycosyltransferase [Candidatus Eremiobacteraeota bacterium]|nr:glycosyltransferase [Candidatus Eremiobacteraeota bacterium]